MTPNTEIELKFQVPRAMRSRLAAEVARSARAVERSSLAAMYLDTGDRQLARAGLSWRLRREGRRWVQTLKCRGSKPLERFEHEVISPDARHDATRHAGTPAGERLLKLLRDAQRDGAEVCVRFRTEFRRTARRIRARGAIVEVALDEGRLTARDATQRICEIEFELVSGSAAAMLALAQRWQKRFSLVYDPRTKAERGDLLSLGTPHPPVRKAVRPEYPNHATASDAFGAVIDECLAQITRNAIGLHEGDLAEQAQHVHQLRVGIRRLRCALRSFGGWLAAPPAPLVDGLRSVFATLGRARDSAVLESGVTAELMKVGAPPLILPAIEEATDPLEVAAAPETQQVFLAWLAWRAEQAETVHPVATESDLPRDAQRRLRRWHERIVTDWQEFDALDEPCLHALRKRIKRQRYAVEFFAPALKRRQVDRYLHALAVVQDRMGELNDLFVARTRYEKLVASDAAAWFALGWLAARIAQVRSLAAPALGRLAKTDPPVRRPAV